MRGSVMQTNQPDPLRMIELLDEAFNRSDIEAMLDFYEEGQEW